MRPRRFELLAYSFGGCRSIQLSYGRVTVVYIGSGDLLSSNPSEAREPGANSQEPRAGTKSRLSPPMPAIAAFSTIASAPATTAAGALSFRARLIHDDGAASDFCPVQRGDGFFAFFGVCHFHKSKSARSSGLTVSQNAHAIHLPVSLEKLPQLIFNRIEAEIPDENVFQGAPLSANRGAELLQIESGCTRVRKRAESIANPGAWAREEYIWSWAQDWQSPPTLSQAFRAA